MTLKLVNNVTKKEYEFEVTDENDSRLYWHFEDLELEENMDDGEYDYLLYDDEELVAQGLCQIGEYTPEHSQYENDNNYKQYISDGN